MINAESGVTFSFCYHCLLSPLINTFPHTWNWIQGNNFHITCMLHVLFLLSEPILWISSPEACKMRITADPSACLGLWHHPLPSQYIWSMTICCRKRRWRRQALSVTVYTSCQLASLLLLHLQSAIKIIDRRYYLGREGTFFYDSI